LIREFFNQSCRENRKMENQASTLTRLLGGFEKATPPQTHYSYNRLVKQIDHY